MFVFLHRIRKQTKRQMFDSLLKAKQRPFVNLKQSIYKFYPEAFYLKSKTQTVISTFTCSFKIEKFFVCCLDIKHYKIKIDFRDTI